MYRCCNDGSLFLNWPRVIPRLFWNYDLYITKIRNLENQEFLSCHAAAVAEVETAVAAAEIFNLVATRGAAHKLPFHFFVQESQGCAPWAADAS